MPTNLPKISIPTGYESEQRRAAQKRAMADMLTKIGASTGNYNSWSQVAGQLANALAGRLVDKKADKLEDQYNTDLKAGFDKANTDFDTAIGGGMSNEDLVKNFSTNPFLQDRLDPYVKGMERKLTEQQDIVNVPGKGYVTQGSVVGKGPINDPNAGVSVDADGNWTVNRAKMAASLGAQNYRMSNGQPWMPTVQDPASQGAPVNAQPAPAGAPPVAQPAGGGFDINLFTPEEQKVMLGEAMRRRQTGGPAGVPPNQPYGSPLVSNKPPAGHTPDGKPVWLINGEYYDNPEGR